jgi:hypothetical protein
MSVLVVPVLALVGCHSRTASGLARQIAGTDRVVLWDRARVDHLLLTGGEATRVAGAVSKATESRIRYGKRPALFERTIEFYRGTNLLGVVGCESSLVLTDEGVFDDVSGVISQLNRTFPSPLAQRNGVTQLASDILSRPELKGLQPWGQNVLAQWREQSGANRPTAVPSELNPSAVPPWLRQAWPCPPSSIYPAEDLKCLYIEWPGTYGVIVGETNLIISASGEFRYLTNVARGIYAYRR